jgi:ABC-type sugar transport system, periplasmic component
MRQGAEAEAQKAGVKLMTFAGKYDGDNQAQVEAIESLIAAGAKGILITPSDTAAIVPTVEKARQAGILVIALDTPLNPITAADATFATDNFKAGELIGQWAKATLGDKAASAKIALLDLSPNQVTVDVLRDQGFLQGFGIDIKDAKHIGDEVDARIVGTTSPAAPRRAGARRWRTCCRRIPISTSSTPSTSRRRRGPMRR